MSVTTAAAMATVEGDPHTVAHHLSNAAHAQCVMRHAPALRQLLSGTRKRVDGGHGDIGTVSHAIRQGGPLGDVVVLTKSTMSLCWGKMRQMSIVKESNIEAG